MYIVTAPALSHRAMTRWGAEISGIGLVETSIAIAVPGASSPAIGSRPTAHSSVNIFSCTCEHPVDALAAIASIARPVAIVAAASDLPGRRLFNCAFTCPVIRVAAVVAIVVKNLEPFLTHEVLVEGEARR